MRHPYGIWNHLFEVRQKRIWYIMRHPYGIWNLMRKTQNWWMCRLWDIPMGFETVIVLCMAAWHLIMRHPYGIWNFVKYSIEPTGVSLWDIPMGFETPLCFNVHECNIDYETSLWDLKHTVSRSKGVPFGLWDIPMGFETHGGGANAEKLAIMRHPYGIWNDHCIRQTLLLSNIMRHPYGIWNLVPQSKRCTHW